MGKKLFFKKIKMLHRYLLSLGLICKVVFIVGRTANKKRAGIGSILEKGFRAHDGGWLEAQKGILGVGEAVFEFYIL